jgi:hypothetical protein
MSGSDIDLSVLLTVVANGACFIVLVLLIAELTAKFKLWSFLVRLVPGTRFYEEKEEKQ